MSRQRDSSALASEVLEARQAAQGHESPLALEVLHETHYHYAQPVAQSHHIAHLKPLDDEGQQLLDFVLCVRPEPLSWRDSVDRFGNACLHFALSRAHRELQVEARSRVRVSPRFAQVRAAQSPAWETLRDRLRYVARGPFDPVVEFVQPSPYVPRLDSLRSYARHSFAPGRPLAEAAIDLMQRIHRDFEYRSASTEVDTPVAQAFEQRLGVCQDFAHVMIGACRMMGVPARYVSGYLLTRTADESEALVGADASHAWVQVHAPGTPGLPADGWLDLDPTNDRVPGVEHVRVAVGRDFGDVTPLRGVIRGGGRHTLSVGVTTRRWPEPGVTGPVVAL
ncbi:MAG: transglutaminase family protein [Rubrivivax sp.]|nr:transglutaminase family protein [Rubrivivax sp.]